MSYTPGPWAQCNLAIYAAQDGETVANCAGNKELHRSFSDAKLIAAAPELLEALQSIVSIYESSPAHGAMASSMVRIAKDAIAKATGEA